MITDRNQERGLLAHSAKAGRARRKLMALRRRRNPESDTAQLKYFLLYSTVGVIGVFTFGAILFLAGVIG
jgi:hypothetical protein